MLLLAWRYLPLRARRLAIHCLYPRFPLGAVAVIHDNAGRVLLVRQSYHRRSLWGAPGGWVERGETPSQAAGREVLEELGLRVSVGRVLAIGTGPYREISVAFDCTLECFSEPVLSEEIDEIGYFPVGELPPMPANTRRLVEQAVAALA